MSRLEKQSDELKELYENDLWEFAQYINPLYAYGEIHRKIFEDMGDTSIVDDTLYLLPRDHLKSHCIATWVVWTITREPWSTFVYLTAGEDLAEAQMYAIKNMLESERYSLLWPDMINTEESKREKWSAEKINVDHPSRKERGIRDNTVIVKTVKSSTTGLHCSHLVFDDVLVPRFAYTDTGRRDLRQSIAQFSAIRSTDSITKAVGTHYHPADIYHDLKQGLLPIVDDQGEIIGEQPLWRVIEHEVERNGQFLWPRTYQPKLDKWFGFDFKILAKKKADFIVLGEDVQFYAQYYNEPNDPTGMRVKKEHFQYYDVQHLTNKGGVWYYRGKKLNIFAGMDVAWSNNPVKGGKYSDYTAIVIIGVDSEGFIYVLALDQFKTTDYEVYYQHFIDLWLYWGFKQIQLETNSGGKLVKAELEKKLRKEGYMVNIIAKHQAKNEGSKFERHAAIVEPRYKTKTILHARGGLTPVLEEQVQLERPPHDDLEDGLAAAIEISRPPRRRRSGHSDMPNPQVQPAGRFGGRRIRRGH